MKKPSGLEGREQCVPTLWFTGVWRNIGRLGLLAVFALNTTGSAQGTIFNGSPWELVGSQGNLYWTDDNHANEFSDDSSTIMRASKSNQPGQERRLFRITGPANGIPRFGSITYALTSQWFGYVVRHSEQGATIMRLPLTGGTPVVLAESPVKGARNLKNDGSFLYWTDDGGVRKMALAGGAVTTLASATNIALMGLSNNRVYYTQDKLIQKVSKMGGTVSTVLTGGQRITALSVQQIGNWIGIYWGEVSGAVRGHSNAAPTTTTYRENGAGDFTTSSVGYDGTRLMWISCSFPGNSFCSLMARKGAGANTTLLPSIGVGARNLVWDAAQVFWVEVSGIRKFVHP
jgi:hypothetical protein